MMWFGEVSESQHFSKYKNYSCQKLTISMHSDTMFKIAQIHQKAYVI